MSRNCIDFCNWWEKVDLITVTPVYPSLPIPWLEMNRGFFSRLGTLQHCVLGVLNYRGKLFSDYYGLARDCLKCGYEFDEKQKLCWMKTIQFVDGPFATNGWGNLLGVYLILILLIWVFVLVPLDTSVLFWQLIGIMQFYYVWGLTAVKFTALKTFLYTFRFTTLNYGRGFIFRSWLNSYFNDESDPVG
jgi:hypothetical protein